MSAILAVLRRRAVVLTTATVLVAAGTSALVTSTSNADQLPVGPVNCSVAGNLVQNCSFELGTTGWTGINGTTITEESSDPHSGANELKMAKIGSTGTVSQTLTVTPSTTYRLGYWLAHPIGDAGTNSFKATISNVFPIAATVTSDSFSNDSTGWAYTFFAATFISKSSGSPTVNFISRDDGSGHAWYVDDVIVVPATLPVVNTTPAPTVMTVGDSYTISDTTTLSSTSGTPVGTLTYGFYDSIAGCATESSPIVSGTVSVNGDGPYTYTDPTSYTPPSSGLYWWRVDYSGDYENIPASDTFLTLCTEGVLVSDKIATTSTLTATSLTPGVNQLDTFTDTVTPSSASTSVPSGNVYFYVDGGILPYATVALNGSGVATLPLTFGAGSHTVKALYLGDSNFVGSTSNTLTVTVSCTTTITSDTNGGVNATRGSTCIVGATVNGSISVGPGATLDLEGATVKGSISSDKAAGVRICGSTVQAMTIALSTGFVVIGDPGGVGHATPNNDCAANTVNGNIQAVGNTHGLVIVGNTISGTITNSGNSGTSPLGQPVTVSGNHS
jgi:hypothetical protein